MGLPHFSIRRPITTLMSVLFVILFGSISLFNLPQELFPPISFPQLTVATVYSNAAPEEIETLITKPVEEAVGTVSGLRRVRSISKEGISLVFGEFGWNENMDFATLKVREKIDLMKERLPRESEEPLVMKHNPLERPIMTLSVTGKRSPVAVREIARRDIKDSLEKVEGVASATISGGLEREILVEIDQARLFARDVPIMDVVHAITNANLNYPAGTIKESFYEYLIRTLGEFQTVEEIRDIPVKTIKDDENMYQASPEDEERKIAHETNLVLLRDIADVKDTYKERTSYSRYNKNATVLVSVQKQAQTNTLLVVNRLKRVIGQLEEELPEDIGIVVVNDESKFIRESIKGVRDAAILGGIIVFFVLFFFLRNWRTSGIVTVSMPVSIMAVFIAMHSGGISLNMMSLGGLALGVGMLVDNAIVVLENITRHREMGKLANQASGEGAQEVSNAIIAATLTTVFAFLPMGFVYGMAGQLFKQLAFTVICSLIASLFVALSLVPLLYTKIKSVSGHEQVFTKYVDRFEAFLKNFLENKSKGFIAVIVIFILSLMVYQALDKELLPKMDQGKFVVKVNMPAGTNLEGTNQVVMKIENFILSLPEVRDASVIVGSTRGKRPEDIFQRLEAHQAEMVVRLKAKRRIRTKELVQKLDKKISDIGLEDVRVEYLLDEGVFGGTVEESSPIVIEVKGKNIPEMQVIVQRLIVMLNNIRGIYGVKTDTPERAPETQVIIDKDRAALYQLSVVDIAQTTQAALRGYIASEFKEKGYEVDIRVRLREIDRDNFDKLARVQLNSPTGTKVPLGSLVRFVSSRGPNEIKRRDQERTIIVSANIFRRPLKDIVGEIERGVEKMKVSDEYTVKLAGESEEMKISFASLRNAIILAVILVYMIMAAQFESLWQPFIIMFTFPMAIIGVILALMLTGTSVNVVVLLGVVVLGGIVVNNGIVLIDYINILRAKGMSVYDSVCEASKARLRPILMTAVTTILSLIPMSLAAGEGAELRAPLAISIMGGLFVSTFLSLFIIPSLYLASHELRVKIFKR